jgi:hypothetical protein
MRAVGARGMLRLDLRANVLWRYRGKDDEVSVPLADDAGAYDCIGPIDAVVDTALGRPTANNSPAELGARTVEILDAAYRSAESGAMERIDQRATPAGSAASAPAGDSASAPTGGAA